MSSETLQQTRPVSSHLSFFTIPGPIRALFKLFPLHTLRESPLPVSASLTPCSHASKSSDESDDAALPELHIFIHPEGARSGRPSFNPSCLKVQTLLALSGIRTTLVPSSNHASPTGSLPFLLLSPTPTPTSSSAPAPIATEKQFLDFISSRSEAAAHMISTTTQDNRVVAYRALLEGPVRCAWLYALYLSGGNASLLTKLYLAATTNSAAVHAVIRAQLASAARDEIRAYTRSELASADPAALYCEARAAFAALDGAVSAGGEGEGYGWFFGAQGPQIFDVEVYSYTELLLGRDEVVLGGMDWRDRTLADMVEDCPALVRHRERMAELVKGAALR